MKKALFLLFALTCFSCNENKHEVKAGAYFWERVYEPSDLEEDFMLDRNIDTIHVRYFDLDFNIAQKTSFPVAPIIFKSVPKQKVIPTIFVKNVVFEKIEPEQIAFLAQNVLSLINSINDKNGISINEIQIDCDWTVGTKYVYFEFLKEIKKASNLKISVTIRLHQIKFYEKTGIPPVEKGTLMLYNTGDWKAQTTENSLFDAKEIIKYLDNLPEYPLKLSFAFPIISQKLWYRNGVFIGFVNNIDLQLLGNSAMFKVSGNNLICLTSQNVGKITFRVGDVIRTEKAEPEEIMKIKKLIFEKIEQPKIDLLLFQLNETNIKAYSKQQIDSILSTNQWKR